MLEWRSIIIDGIKTNYLISNTGLVYSNFIKKELKLSCQQGYLFVTLSVGNKPRRFRVHRLVAQTFIENNDSLKNVVNHKDGNRMNNCVDNLEWCTQQENIIHAWRTGLAKSGRKKKVKQYDLQGNLLNIFNSIQEAAKETNSLDSKITLCCQGFRTSHNNYFWRYEDDDDYQTTEKKYVPPTIKKAVGQYDINTGELIAKYESACQAARKINGTQSAITRCCNGKNNHHKGFVWKFLDDEIVQ